MNNVKWCVRVIDKKAERERAIRTVGFLEIANNLYVVAPSKKEARKIIQKQLELRGMVYGRDFSIGIIMPYTGNGKSIAFVGDEFKNCLPHNQLVAYKTFQEKLDSGRNSEVKNGTYTKDVVLKDVPEDLNCPTYICSKGQFVQIDEKEREEQRRQNSQFAKAESPNETFNKKYK